VKEVLVDGEGRERGQPQDRRQRLQLEARGHHDAEEDQQQHDGRSQVRLLGDQQRRRADDDDRDRKVPPGSLLERR
jgi:hypothetical protein